MGDLNKSTDKVPEASVRNSAPTAPIQPSQTIPPHISTQMPQTVDRTTTRVPVPDQDMFQEFNQLINQLTGVPTRNQTASEEPNQPIEQDSGIWNAPARTETEPPLPTQPSMGMVQPTIRQQDVRQERTREQIIEDLEREKEYLEILSRLFGSLANVPPSIRALLTEFDKWNARREEEDNRRLNGEDTNAEQ